MMRRSMSNLLALLTFALAGSATLSAQSDSLAESSVQGGAAVSPAVLSALRGTIAERYVTPIPAESLARFKTAEALIESLSDRHTMLYSPGAFKDFQVAAGQHFGGIGARLGVRRDTVYLASVLPGSPAAKAGLVAFDRLVAIDGRSLVGLPADSAVQLIRGPNGSKARINVVSAGKQRVISLVRDAVAVPSVGGVALLDQKIGVVRLRQFGEGATAEVVNAIDVLVSAGARGIVLDLRGNPGGLLQEGLGIAQLFLPSGSGLVEVRARPGTPAQRARAEAPPKYPTLPLAVLVDGLSASASEILAGALQDGHRAVVLGRQSYGKGSVQETVRLPEGWVVKLTVARWYTPAGRGIDRGSQPADVEIDPDAKHAGGIVPDAALAPDTTLAPPRQAIASLKRATWTRVSDRLADWTEAHRTDSTAAPTRQTADTLLAGLSLPVGVEPALANWLSRALTQELLTARYGETAGEAWALTHDAEVEAARAWLERRLAA
jgi:carboxyl-terminal processing protease